MTYIYTSIKPTNTPINTPPPPPLGCYSAGGKNGPLRGTKGSLLEGGVKVDAFIYSPQLLPSYNSGEGVGKTAGMGDGGVYKNLMHVSDYQRNPLYPTLLEMANAQYIPLTPPNTSQTSSNTPLLHPPYHTHPITPTLSHPPCHTHPITPTLSHPPYHTHPLQVSDWFPTLLEMADVKYIPRLGYELDGVSHYAAWLSMSGRSLGGDGLLVGGRRLLGGSAATPAAPRTTMLYNAATNVDKQDFDYSTNAPFAVRNERYKLIHFFNSTGNTPYQFVVSTHILSTHHNTTS